MESELIDFIPAGTEVILLEGSELDEDGRLWQQINIPTRDVIGWVLADFLAAP